MVENVVEQKIANIHQLIDVLLKQQQHLVTENNYLRNKVAKLSGAQAKLRANNQAAAKKIKAIIQQLKNSEL